MTAQGVARIAVDAGDTGSEHRRPKTVARPSVSHSVIGRIGAGVQPNDEQTHARPYRIRQAANAHSPSTHSRALGPGSPLDTETGPGQQINTPHEAPTLFQQWIQTTTDALAGVEGPVQISQLERQTASWPAAAKIDDQAGHAHAKVFYSCLCKRLSITHPSATTATDHPWHGID
jgi:hypothetical protein